jgi:hypothetical protein
VDCYLDVVGGLRVKEVRLKAVRKIAVATGATCKWWQILVERKDKSDRWKREHFEQQKHRHDPVSHLIQLLGRT